MSTDASGEEPRRAVVLDYLAHGRAADDRPQYQKPPLAHAVGTADFQLWELELSADGAVSIGDLIEVDPPENGIEDRRTIAYGDLSGGAQSELEHVVRELVEADEDRFVEFYNEAGPVTLRLHQLNLLPGIGDKLRDDILDARKRTPFEDFEDIDERIEGLHDPKGVLIERILEEIRDEDVKYKLFARPDAADDRSARE